MKGGGGGEASFVARQTAAPILSRARATQRNNVPKVTPTPGMRERGEGESRFNRERWIDVFSAESGEGFDALSSAASDRHREQRIPRNILVISNDRGAREINLID